MDKWKKYITDLETCLEEEDKQKREMDKQLIQYGSKLKKSELQEALLQLLFDGPEWQHDRFIEENIWGLVAALRGRPSLCFNVEIYQWISACL